MLKKKKKNHRLTEQRAGLYSFRSSIWSMPPMGSVKYGAHLHSYKGLTLTSYCSGRNSSVYYFILVQVLPLTPLWPLFWVLSFGTMFLSLLRMVLLSCLVIRYVLMTRIWRLSWHNNWLGIGPVSLSDGECLISAETSGTRISDPSSC